MDSTASKEQTAWRERACHFRLARVPAIPADPAQTRRAGAARWTNIPIVEALEARADAHGQWSLIRPPRGPDDETARGAELSNPEHALCAEAAGGQGGRVCARRGGRAPLAAR